MSICPKNKSSKARRDKRRANWKIPLTNRELNEEDVKYDFTSFFYCYAYDKKMSDGHFLVDFYNNIN